MDTQGKVCLITGSARRLGRALALDLAAGGAQLAIHYHDSEQEARQTAEQCREAHDGNRAECFQADLSDPQSTRSLARNVLTAFGRVDILINSAALFLKTGLLADHDERWDKIIEVNLHAPCILTEKLAPGMKEQGQGLILNMTDALTHPPRSQYSAYNISKVALEARTRQFAVQLAPQIRVNAIAPGVALPPDNAPPDLLEKLKSDIPLGRIGQAGDIVDACRFLIASDYITGATLAVDGGASLVGHSDFE
jgi:pteridine reductase